MFSLQSFIEKYILLFMFCLLILTFFFIFLEVKKDEKIDIELIKGEKENVVIYSEHNCKLINHSFYCWEE